MERTVYTLLDVMPERSVSVAACSCVSLLCRILLSRSATPLSLPLMDIWVVSTLGLLRIRLLRIFPYMSFCEFKHSFLLGKYTGVDVLGYKLSRYIYT